MPDQDRFTITPEPPNQSQSIKVCFENPALAGQEVTIDIDDGAGGADSLKIRLDANGMGCSDWVVPSGWQVIHFNHSTSATHTTSVNP